MAKNTIYKKLEKRLAYITAEMDVLDRKRSDKTQVQDADHTTWSKLLIEKINIISRLRDK